MIKSNQIFTAMKMKNLFLLVASIIFLIGCQKQNEPTDNLYAFKEYVNYTTSGVVSVTEKIMVNLGKEIDTIKEGHVINPKTFDISPNVDGELKMLNKHSFQFIPKVEKCWMI